jgi:hypothetical protein
MSMFFGILPPLPTITRYTYAGDVQNVQRGMVPRIFGRSNERQIGEGTMAHTVPVAFSSYAGMDIGCDNGLVVDLAYEDKAPYPFTGTVHKVIFDLKPATHEDEQALHEHAQMQGIGQGAAG